ncbi:MAG: hypothetical protein GY913_14015 [Proteobacteria bacterium]|nr:hypothetical protein [Pseudomonadota bacterium]
MWRRAVATAALLTATIGVAEAAEVTTSNTGHVQNPVWSPDGQWLAFEMNNMSNEVQLWLTKVQGANPGSPSELKIPGATGTFGTGGYLAASPTWTAAQGMMVIFEGSNPGGTLRLYYATPGAGAPNELIQASQMTGNLHAPAMSADGGRFAFVSDKTGNGDIYVWEVQSGDMSPIMETSASEHFPVWNDAATTLTYSRKNNGTEDLFTWDGSGVKPLKGGNGDQTRPVWVGDQVAYFTSERGEGLWDVAVTDTGGKRSVVAKDVRLPSRSTPAISPDGQWVAYGTMTADKDDRILLTRLDGSKTVEIQTGGKAAGEPSLIEAGGRLLLAYTALPEQGSDWRRLHVVDITGKL